MSGGCVAQQNDNNGFAVLLDVKEPAAQKHRKSVKIFIDALLESNFLVEYDGEGSCADANSFFWLDFSCHAARACLGIKRSIFNLRRFNSLLQRLLSTTTASQSFDLKIEAGDVDKSKHQFIRFRCKSEMQEVLILFMADPAFSMSAAACCYPMPLLHLALIAEVPHSSFFISANFEQLKIFLVSEIGSQSRSRCFAGLISSGKDIQSILLEEVDMDEKFLLRTILRVGSLEIGLDQLLSLQSGSEIRFSLPACVPAELELGGRLIARGNLKSEPRGFVLELSETYCQQIASSHTELSRGNFIADSAIKGL